MNPLPDLPPNQRADLGEGVMKITWANLRDVLFTVVRLVEPRLVLSGGEGWSGNR